MINFVRVSDIDRGTLNPLWNCQDCHIEERRRVGPALTDAQRDELEGTRSSTLKSRFGLTVRHISHSGVVVA
jgi:hypothetical protein